jgi:hypothetical protein
VAVAVGLATAIEAGFLFRNPQKFIDEGPMHLFFKLTGSHLPQISPVLITSGFVLLASLLCYLAIRQAERWSVAAMMAAYLCGLFALPAVINLWGSFGRHGFTIDALGFWEGGNWIAGCTPLLAAVLAERLFDPVKHELRVTSRASLSA